MAAADDFMCGRWAGRTEDACDPGYGAERHGLREGVYYNTHGCSFRQLPQDLPWLAPFYTQFELRFNSIPYVCWSAAHWNTALAICAVYLAVTFGGPPALRWLKAPELKSKSVLAAWNLLLAAFSLVGFLRTMPHLLFYALSHEQGLAAGFRASVCRPAETSFGQGAAGLWTMLFIFSKVPELVDTLFMVLAQKDVIVLHWYHHFTVLLYCWHSYMTRSSAGLYFISMNYGVHAIMYFYFACVPQSRARLDRAPGPHARTSRPDLAPGARARAAHAHAYARAEPHLTFAAHHAPPASPFPRRLTELAVSDKQKKAVKSWDMYVTSLQISQMVVGIIVCSAVYYYQSEGGIEACDMTVTNYRAGFLMYASYFVLFAMFALEK